MYGNDIPYKLLSAVNVFSPKLGLSSSSVYCWMNTGRFFVALV